MESPAEHLLSKIYQEAEIPVIMLNPPTNYPFPWMKLFQLNSVHTIPEKQKQIDQSMRRQLFILRSSQQSQARSSTIRLIRSIFLHKISRPVLCQWVILG